MTSSSPPVAEIVERLRGADPDHVSPVDALRLFDTDSATFPLSPEDAEAVLDLIDQARDALIALQSEIEAARMFGGGYFADVVTEETREAYRKLVASRKGE